MRRALVALPLVLLAAAAFGVPEAPPEWPAPGARPGLRYLAEFKGKTAPPRRPWYVQLLRGLVGLGPEGGWRRRERAMRLPTGLALHGGSVYVADAGARAVLRYSEAEDKIEWLPRGGRLRLLSPVAVAVAPDGRVFVADSGLGKVFVLSPEGYPAGELAGAAGNLERPVALALAGERLYVSDVARHRVAAFDLSGKFLSSFGARGSGKGELNRPTYLCWDERGGRLFVVDSGNARVQWFAPDGRLLGGFGELGGQPGYLARPRGIALDSGGNLYIADGAFESVQVFDLEGRLLYNLGQEGGGAGQFRLPGGVAVDGRDRLYVADTHNARLQVFQYLAGGAP